MILYGTKQTIQRYNLMTVDQLPEPALQIAQPLFAAETGNAMLEWGMKLFYFDGRKCIQLVNFASKFTLFLFDVRKKEMQDIGNLIANYLLTLFKNEANVCAALKKMFFLHPVAVVAPLKNKSIIATLNHNQTDYSLDSQRFWDYIENGVLHSLKINHDFNFNYLVCCKADGKKEYYFAGELLRNLLLKEYG